MAKRVLSEADDLEKVDAAREREGRNLADEASFWHSFSYTSSHEVR